MSSRSLLRARIDALEEQLADAKRLLTKTAALDPHLERLDPRLHVRLTARFNDILSARRAELRALGNDLHRGAPLPGCWKRFDDVREACVSLFSECLAFFEGTLARQGELDGGLCQIADHLLDQIAEDARVPWNGLTVMAEKEYYGDTAHIIRLRFPQESLWLLPIAVHEFGHFVGPRIGLDSYTRLRHLDPLAADGAKTGSAVPEESYPIQQILIREWGKGNRIRWSYVYELFADLFASYALGMAYAYACVYLRFDPASAHSRSLSHPSPAERAYVVLTTLREMHTAGGLGVSFEPELSRLEALWRDSVAAAGDVRQLTGDDVARLDSLWSEFYGRLHARPSDLPYSTFVRARSIADELGDWPPRAPPDQRLDTLPDLLNGAWMAAAPHWENLSRVKQIGSAALGRLHDVVRNQSAEVRAL